MDKQLKTWFDWILSFESLFENKKQESECSPVLVRRKGLEPPTY